MASNNTKMWEKMGIDSKGAGTYKNRMGLSNTITRDNGLPLDLSSVHANRNDAIVYAATNPTAYVGQILSAGEVAYIITEEPQGKVTISSYRDSITGKLVSGEAKEYDVYIKPLVNAEGGESADVVEGEGIDIVESAGQKVISLEVGGINDVHINSVSVEKLIQEQGTFLILNGGKANDYD